MANKGTVLAGGAGCMVCRMACAHSAGMTATGLPAFARYRGVQAEDLAESAYLGAQRDRCLVEVRGALLALRERVECRGNAAAPCVAHSNSRLRVA